MEIYTNPFQVGDRVVCVKGRWGVESGELGTVCFAEPDYTGEIRDIGVRWDIADPSTDPIRHDCGGSCEKLHGLWYYAEDMKLHIIEEEIGDMGADALMSLLF